MQQRASHVSRAALDTSHILGGTSFPCLYFKFKSVSHFKCSKFSTSCPRDMILFSVTVLYPLLHRKACVACGCSMVDHTHGGDLEDDQRMGRLLAASPCSHLTAKVKGGGGLRMYKRNRMIVTNPVVSRKDPTFNTTTYDWAPAGLNQKLVRGWLFV